MNLSIKESDHFGPKMAFRKDVSHYEVVESLSKGSSNLADLNICGLIHHNGKDELRNSLTFLEYAALICTKSPKVAKSAFLFKTYLYLNFVHNKV